LAESATLDTSVFEGAPGYIMKDAFSNVSWVENFGLPSGWDVDKRGGDIVGGDNSKCQIMDSSSTGIVSLSRKVLPHKSGNLTFETAFTMEKKAETGYSYTLEGLGKKVFKISTEGNNITVLLPDGKTKPVEEKKTKIGNDVCHIHVDFWNNRDLQKVYSCFLCFSGFLTRSAGRLVSTAFYEAETKSRQGKASGSYRNMACCHRRCHGRQLDIAFRGI
jgi:hypothetical protein